MKEILRELESNRAELDALTAKLVRDGVADVSGGGEQSLIVRGRGHLLDEATEQDLERVRMLFDDLERKQGGDRSSQCGDRRRRREDFYWFGKPVVFALRLIGHCRALPGQVAEYCGRPWRYWPDSLELREGHPNCGLYGGSGIAPVEIGPAPAYMLSA